MRLLRLFPYLLAGTAFGVVLSKSQAISWFRMQEMFRLQSFHMYGLIGSAVATGAVSLILIKKFQAKTAHGETVVIPRKTMGKRYPIGGIIFGLGWGLGGVCPGPMFALVGRGMLVVSVVLLSALVGTRVYAAIQHKLPH
jgi:uncharacterized membrane protein YedE/YeeE